MFEKIIAWLKGKNVENLTDAERTEFKGMVEGSPDALPKPPEPGAPPVNPFSVDDAALLRQMAKDLAETKAANKKQQEEIDEAKKTQAKAKIEAAIQKGIDEGRVGSQDTEKQNKIREAYNLSYEHGEFLLANMPAKINNDPGKKTETKTPAPSGSVPKSRAELMEAAKSAFKSNMEV